MRAGDTTDDADALQIEVLRGMTGGQRFELACEMSDAVRQIALAGLRNRHPEWSETDLLRGLMRQLYSPTELPPDLR